MYRNRHLHENRYRVIIGLDYRIASDDHLSNGAISHFTSPDFVCFGNTLQSRIFLIIRKTFLSTRMSY